MKKDLLVADRYAQALFEIARVTYEDEAIEEELDSFSAALKASPVTEKFLQNPQLSTAQKRTMLMKIYQAHQHPVYGTLLNFFTLLFEKNRFELIHEIVVSFKRIADESRGQGVAEIRTASPLNAQSQARIVSSLTRIAGYNISARMEVDPSLIGGAVVRIKNKVLDGSVRYQLETLKKALIKNRSV